MTGGRRPRRLATTTLAGPTAATLALAALAAAAARAAPSVAAAQRATRAALPLPPHATATGVSVVRACARGATRGETPRTRARYIIKVKDPAYVL